MYGLSVRHTAQEDLKPANKILSLMFSRVLAPSVCKLSHYTISASAMSHYEPIDSNELLLQHIYLYN